MARGGSGFLLATVLFSSAAAFAFERSDPSRVHALLVSGGIRQSSNHVRFWGDISLAYNMLRSTGVPRENITILWSSGDPSRDLCLVGRSCEYCSRLPEKSSDFDRDGTDDIDGPATFENVAAAFSSLESRLADSDQLFVYFTDHGVKTSSDEDLRDGIAPHASFCLWDGARLTDSMLSYWCRHLPCPVVFAFQCCYSGGAIRDLLDADGTRFIATAGAYVATHAGDTAPAFDQWSYYFFSALRGSYPSSFAHPELDGRACDADADGDGLVSFREAAKFALLHRALLDVPQYAESWAGCGDVLFPVPVLTADELSDCEALHANDHFGFDQFRTPYLLTLGPGAHSARTGGGYECEREWIDIGAPEKMGTRDGKVLFFSRWDVNPAKADLGNRFDWCAPATEFFMPECNLTLSPRYSPWPQAGTELYAGTYSLTDGDGETLSVTVAPDGRAVMAGRSTETFVVPAADQEDELLLCADFGGGRIGLVGRRSPLAGGNGIAVRDPGVIATASVVRGKAGGRVLSDPPTGQVAFGENVRLTAQPEPGAVFVKWKVLDAEGRQLVADGSEFSPTLDYVYEAREDVFVTAEFVDCGTEPEKPVLSGPVETLSRLSVGVKVNALLSVQDAARPVRFASSVLPPGLRIDPETGRITGVPTRAWHGKLSVSATGLRDGRLKDGAVFEVDVDELPEWGQGDFFGVAYSDGADMRLGTASLNVGRTGRISGKFSIGGLTWRFAGTGYDERIRDSGREGLLASCSARSERGLERMTIRLSPSATSGDFVAALVEGGVSGVSVELRRNVWTDGWKVPLPRGWLDLSACAEGLSALITPVGRLLFVVSGTAAPSGPQSTFVFPNEQGDLLAYLTIPFAEESCVGPQVVNLTNLLNMKESE